ncbi:MAG: hypothetical protein ACJAX5_000228 [Patiriisocius sp.]|jgi:hypothetical protein
MPIKAMVLVLIAASVGLFFVNGPNDRMKMVSGSFQISHGPRDEAQGESV